MTLRVQLVFVGEPFNREAVIHTLRHAAMRADWQITLDANAEHRIVYATTDDANEIDARPNDVVILSSRAVADHLQSSDEPFPLGANLLPFPHSLQRNDWICADVIAGAFAALNLWYEERTRANVREGWITWREDWMATCGLTEPQPLADQWLDAIVHAADCLGWAKVATWTQFTIVLTHDVDYLPGVRDRGLPRLLRAIARQIVLRQRPLDAMRLLVRYWQSPQPYFSFDAVMRAEALRGARSSFQLVVAHRHRFDPDYAIAREPIASALQKIAASDWEICLHGSYAATRTPDMLCAERIGLEREIGAPVRGHRQHYLNFYPSRLFDAVERAGLDYDLSVGYNDASGARAGTCFPYRPFNLTANHAHNFWEIPFVLMDTTLATTHCFAPREAFQYSQKILAPIAQARGCVALIWHLEQLSGLLDPGFERVYFDLLDWLCEQGARMVAGKHLVREWQDAWTQTLE